MGRISCLHIARLDLFYATVTSVPFSVQSIAVLLKVRKSWKQIILFSFLPKNEQNPFLILPLLSF